MELQRRMAAAIYTPLTASGDLAAETMDGCSMAADAAEYIKPNNRLSSFERLEIYSRSYWFRVLDSLYDDFPGLAAILGKRGFERVARDYLTDCPSRSYTLRNLGSRLENWLAAHPELAGKKLALALDMVRLEWAHIEAFDGEQKKVMGPGDLLELGPTLRLALQPYIRLLKLNYPVDDLRIAVNASVEGEEATSNAVMHRKRRTGIHRITRRKAAPIYVAVHRVDFFVYYRRLTREQFLIVSALRNGKTIKEAIESGLTESRLSPEEQSALLESSFSMWASFGWFCQDNVA